MAFKYQMPLLLAVSTFAQTSVAQGWGWGGFENWGHGNDPPDWGNWGGQGKPQYCKLFCCHDKLSQYRLQPVLSA
jgi:hypothetical protein